MSYYIIIRGPLGCGKSTIARKLAKILNAYYLSIDKILEERNLNAVSKREGCIPSVNFLKANKIVIPSVKEKLAKGRIVIFDGCFYHKGPLENLMQRLEYPNYVFTLKAPVEVCIERDSKRREKYGKGATDAVYKLVSRFDYGIAIDVTKDLDIVIREIRSHLP